VPGRGAERGTVKPKRDWVKKEPQQYTYTQPLIMKYLGFEISHILSCQFERTFIPDNYLDPITKSQYAC
jgi:hypothetical protein